MVNPDAVKPNAMKLSFENEVYEPQEDSFLMQKHVRKMAEGIVLDMGTGSGILAIEAAKSKRTKKVYAVDVNRKALEIAHKNAENSKVKIEFHYSNLFSFFKNRKNKKTNKKMNKKTKFDLIIFNPPYLPEEKLEPEDEIKKALTGGKKGHELVERFLSEANAYLKEKGKILVVFSSITSRQKIEDIITKYCFDFKKIDEQKFAFETLYVYLIKKSEVLKQLDKFGIEKTIRFAKGKRGIIYTGTLKNKKIAIKVKRADSKAKGRIENEIRYLRILNKQNIAPKLMLSGRKFFVYTFIEGKFIKDFLETANKEEISKIIKDVFRQLYVLDSMRLNKEEMHYPVKHIIIKQDLTPVLVDFERMHKSNSLKNITQFCQFLSSNYVAGILSKKGIVIDKKVIIILSQEYKHEYSEEKLNKIIRYICH